MKLRAILAFLVAALLGASVWALSPLLAGHVEPWDADGPYYVLMLAIAGAISGGLFPRPLSAHYLGAVAGQAVYELLFLDIGPLFLLGLLFLLGFSIVFLAASAAAAFVRVRLASDPNAN